MTNLQPGDVVRVLHPWRFLWCGYIFARRPTLLGPKAGHLYDYGIRFTDWDRGLHWFLYADLEEESLIPFLEPDAQAGEGKNRRKRRKYDFPQAFDDELPPEPEPGTGPEPEPTPEPTPEPAPEPKIRLRIEASDGMALVVGDWWLAPGVVITLIDPYGNVWRSEAGSKTEHGAGGFEFIPWAGAGLYTLIAGGHEFGIPVAGKFMRLIFEQTEEEMARLISALMDKARALRIMAKWPGLGFEVDRLR